jgi:type I restriction enzyme M protein
MTMLSRGVPPRTFWELFSVSENEGPVSADCSDLHPSADCMPVSHCFLAGFILIEGAAGEIVRRELFKQADAHSCFDSHAGSSTPKAVRAGLAFIANVLFFDRKPAAEKPWTEKLWIYDLRTNKHFTLKENPLKRSDLDNFVANYNPKNRHERKESERFKSFTYEDLLKRDKLNLDIFWLKDESLEDSANLPDPDIIAAEIVEDLQAALAQFAKIASDLKR